MVVECADQDCAVLNEIRRSVFRDLCSRRSDVGSGFTAHRVTGVIDGARLSIFGEFVK